MYLPPLIRRRPPEAATILVHNKDQPVGDSFIQAGFFHALRCRYPAARITFAVSLGGTAYAGPLAQAMAPFLDEVLVEQALTLTRDRLWPWTPPPLAGRRFDLILDMEKKWWRTLILRRVRHRWFVSASKHFLFSDRRPVRYVKPARLADQYTMLLDALAMPVRAELLPPDFVRPTLVAHARSLLPPGPTYVGLVPGAGDRGKCWPLPHFLALGRFLADTGRVPVFLLGPMEAEWLPAVRDAVPTALLPAWSADGTLRPEFRDPLQVVALGPALAAAVSNDCGTAHMLAAAATPLVTLFGYTNPVKYAPLTPRLITLSARDWGSDRVAAIPEDAVRRALETLLGEGNCIPPAPSI